jgi:hypothetical protein
MGEAFRPSDRAEREALIDALANRCFGQPMLWPTNECFAVRWAYRSRTPHPSRPPLPTNSLRPPCPALLFRGPTVTVKVSLTFAAWSTGPPAWSFDSWS